MVKIFNVEWMQPTREFQCPFCGVLVLDTDGRVAPTFCSHFLCTWNREREDFDDYADDVEEILDDSDDDIDSSSSDPSLKSLPESAVVYYITTRDEALGPTNRVDAIAFDPSTD